MSPAHMHINKMVQLKGNTSILWKFDLLYLLKHPCH
jgi:hypothetical protein